MANKQTLIDFIAENADRAWIWHFIDEVVEFDWVAEMNLFPVETLLTWAKELGYKEKTNG